MTRYEQNTYRLAAGAIVATAAAYQRPTVAVARLAGTDDHLIKVTLPGGEWITYRDTASGVLLPWDVSGMIDTDQLAECRLAARREQQRLIGCYR